MSSEKRRWFGVRWKYDLERQGERKGSAESQLEKAWSGVRSGKRQSHRGRIGSRESH